MAKTPKSEIGAQLDSLAKSIAKDAQSDKLSFTDRLDAFKVLTTYYVGITRAKAKTPDEDPSGSTFDNFRNKLAETDDIA